MEVLCKMKKQNTRVQLSIILVYIWRMTEVMVIFNVHILELVLNERALKIYFPKLHNSFTLFTISNLITIQ